MRISFIERLHRVLSKRCQYDFLMLCLPPFVLALAFFLMPGQLNFFNITFYFFIVVLVVFLGIGIKNKWYKRGWFYFWIGAALFYIYFFFYGKYSIPAGQDFFVNVWYYICYSWNCHGLCYAPLSPISSITIVLILSLLVVLVRRTFRRFSSHILYAVFSFWGFYLIIMPPFYEIMADHNLRISGAVPKFSTLSEALASAYENPWIFDVFHAASVSLFLLAMLLTFIPRRPFRRFILPFFAIFSLLFMFLNSPTLRFMKHHIGYSIRWAETFSGNRENLMALFRDYLDILWIRPAFYVCFLLVGIWLLLIFLKIEKILGLRKKEIDNNQRSGFVSGLLFFPLKFICWAAAVLSLAYFSLRVLTNRVNIYRFDEVLSESLFKIGKDKENLLFFLIFMVIVMIVIVISLVRGFQLRHSGQSSGLFSLDWLRSRALEIVCVMIILFVIIYTCTGFNVTSSDWQEFQFIQKKAVETDGR